MTFTTGISAMVERQTPSIDGAQAADPRVRDPIDVQGPRLGVRLDHDRMIAAHPTIFYSRSICLPARFWLVRIWFER